LAAERLGDAAADPAPAPGDQGDAAFQAVELHAGLETLSRYDSSTSPSLPPPLRIGIDSYSYHRLLGENRPGESPAPRLFARGTLDAVEHARRLEVDGISLETCFLGRPEDLDAAALRSAAGPLEIVLAWGHPHGLELGGRPGAVAELVEWLEVAQRLGCSIVRCVAASPRFRDGPIPRERLAATAAALAAVTTAARERGLRLALENHGDLSAAELLSVLDLVGDEALGVCLDTANALRVGDDPLTAARALSARAQLVHLKDVEPAEPAADPVAGPRSVPYGEGVVPLGGVLRALEDAGFTGLVCVELGQLAPGADEVALVEASVAWLRRYASSKG
jgi:sugar phosphate isomerase/epimerase